MIGVIFCGGRSSRMGSDKGLLLKNDKIWAEIAAEKLEQLNLQVYFSVNAEQIDKYGQYFIRDFLIEDSIPVEGPVAGLLSIHSRFPDHDLFVLACDLIDVTVEIMKKLMSEFRQREGEHDFFVFSQENSFQPFPGIYSREGLSKIAGLSSLNKLEKHSMKYLLEIGNTYSIALREDEKANFTNYNSPEDFKHHPH